MTTTTSDIADLFMTRVDDFRLDSIYTSQGDIGLVTFLEPYLLDSIVEFDICNQTLNYTVTSGSSEGYFDTDLTLKNQIILSRLMVRYWLTKNINDILQMNNLLQDHDFKQYSQAQNLSSKREYLNSVKEELSQLLTEYDYKNNDWTSWKNGIFD